MIMENIVIDETARVNATVAMSDFEWSILEEVVSWIHTKESNFTVDMTTKDAIIAYWDERLN
jgi:hypothetical protein